MCIYGALAPQKKSYSFKPLYVLIIVLVDNIPKYNDNNLVLMFHQHTHMHITSFRPSDAYIYQ